MKKALRLLALLLAAACLCVSLCGCGALDEARANHAFVTENGSLLLGNVEYIPLPACEELCPTFSYERTVYATEADVPVLLSGLLGSPFDISEDEIFLSDYWMEGGYYCRADKYEEILRRINEGFTPTGYGYVYYDYEKDEEKYYTLTPGQKEAVDDVYANVTGEQLHEMADIYFEYYATLVQHSEDMLFRREFIDIGLINGNYYLVDFAYADRTESGEEETVLYKVPTQHNATFAAIMAELVKAESYWTDEFYYEDREEYDEEYDEALFGA